MAEQKQNTSLFYKTVNVLEWVAKTFLVLDIFGMVALMTMQIINRYLFEATFTWTEELARYLFIWGTVMGAAVALRRYELVGVSFIMEKFKKNPVVYKTLRLVSFAAVGIFFAYFSVYGYKLLKTAYIGNVKSPALQIPMHVVYLIFPLGGIFIIIFTIACIVEVLKEESITSEPTEKMNLEE